MKHKKSILAAVALSVLIGAGYPPALSQQQTESKQEKPAATASKISQADMLKVEEALKAKGYDPGAVDGKGDKDTTAAIRAFQEKNNLQVTGEMDQLTAEALGIVIVIVE